MVSTLNLVCGAVALLLTSLNSMSAMAAPVSTLHTQVDLISETKTLRPGKPFSLALRFQLEEGWHIYWINAGDSGQPPQIIWTLPRGVNAGAIQWPAPQRLPAPPLVNYGYENHVLLEVPFEVQTPQSLPAWNDFHVEANVRWLVCKEVCIPGKAKLTLSIPIRDSVPAIDAETSPFFEEARVSLPRRAPSNWKAVVHQGPGAQPGAAGLVLEVSGDPRLKNEAKEAVFYPLDPDQIENSPPQKARETAVGLALSLKRSDQLTTPLSHLRGVLTLANSSGAQSFILDVPVKGDVAPGGAANTAALSGSAFGTQAVAERSLWGMLLFAFIGGLILNLMPCVFPVLSIKILGFVTAPRSERAELPWHGLAYTAGILVSFWVLVGTLLTLRAGGQQLGWGFQLQSPAFIAVLAIFLFVFGLNLAGVFEFDSAFSNLGGGLARREGWSGSFFTGVLATIVATPCTAPFMGSAVGFALSQSTFVAFLIFTFLGVGLALPYLVLSIEPSLGGFLPKPGRWMETFKQFVSFPVFATVLWLSWVFGVQAGIEPLFRLLSALLFVSFAAWIMGRWVGKRAARTWAGLFLVLALLLALTGARVSEELAAPLPGDPVASSIRDLEWEKFSPEKIDFERSAGRPVFVDFTAAWCVSCKVNELLVFRSSEVKSELRRKNFALMKADWTTYDPVITRALAEFGRSGVPLYVIYPADRSRDPIVLPEIINAGIVLRSLKTLN